MANIPTEPIGSIPRPRSLIQAIAANPQDPALDALYDSAVRNTIAHTCPGSDLDSMHSADVDHAAPLPSLFELMAGSFFVALAREADPVHVLRNIRDHLKPDQMVFVGVIDPTNPRVDGTAMAGARLQAH